MSVTSGDPGQSSAAPSVSRRPNRVSLRVRVLIFWFLFVRFADGMNTRLCTQGIALGRGSKIRGSPKAGNIAQRVRRRWRRDRIAADTQGCTLGYVVQRLRRL
jgi:hypothetical protein